MTNNEWTEVQLGTSWDYKSEKVLIGVFTGKEDGVGTNNSTIYNIQKEDGTYVSVWGSTVLDIRMKNLIEGEEVKIEYLGDKPSPNRKGKFYHDFKVFHRPMEEIKIDEAGA